MSSGAGSELLFLSGKKFEGIREEEREKGRRQRDRGGAVKGGRGASWRVRIDRLKGRSTGR